MVQAQAVKVMTVRITAASTLATDGGKARKFICGILNRGVANSFWNHLIQISSKQMYFQDIYSNLWKVKLFGGNIYSLKSNTILRDSYACPRWIFIFDSDQAQINGAFADIFV